jgi:ribosomal protein S24E
MELKITTEEQNPLFNRKEIIATIKAESLPTRQEVIKSLSEKYSVPNDALRVLNIKGKFGDKEFTVRAHVYSSKEERNKYEKLSKKEKNAEKPKPAEEKPTEAPAEEKKEEPKPEEKTPVSEAKKLEEKKEEEGKKEKDKSKEEKLNETELQA